MGSHERALAQALIVTPPRAVTATRSPHGAACVLTTAATTAYQISLRQLVALGVVGSSGSSSSSAYDPTSPEGELGLGAPSAGPGGAVGSELTIVSESTDIGIVLGQSVAEATLTGIATAGTLVSNVYTPAAGTCWRIRDSLVVAPPWPGYRFKLERIQDEFLGIWSVAAGTVRFYVSSEAALRT